MNDSKCPATGRSATACNTPDHRYCDIPRTGRASAVKFAYNLNPGDITDFGVVTKVISGEGETEVTFESPDDAAYIVVESMSEIKVYFNLDNDESRPVGRYDTRR